MTGWTAITEPTSSQEGLATGDYLYFVGYGTIADGATFHQIDATTWEVSSADRLTHDIITFAGGAAIDANDFVFV